jgi:hypothetical protein
LRCPFSSGRYSNHSNQNYGRWDFQIFLLNLQLMQPFFKAGTECFDRFSDVPGILAKIAPILRLKILRGISCGRQLTLRLLLQGVYRVAGTLRMLARLTHQLQDTLLKILINRRFLRDDRSFLSASCSTA